MVPHSNRPLATVPLCEGVRSERPTGAEPAVHATDTRACDGYTRARRLHPCLTRDMSVSHCSPAQISGVVQEETPTELGDREVRAENARLLDCPPERSHMRHLLNLMHRPEENAEGRCTEPSTRAVGSMLCADAVAVAACTPMRAALKFGASRTGILTVNQLVMSFRSPVSPCEE